jgi:hypothetical protein
MLAGWNLEWGITFERWLSAFHERFLQFLTDFIYTTQRDQDISMASLLPRLIS